MQQEDVRWKQRFSNFKKAFGQLTEFTELPSLNKFEKQGLIQCFEYTFELAWKTMKDYLDIQGIEAKTPRATIQEAFRINLIKDGHLWIDALEKRNLLSHTYDEALTEEAVKLIRYTYYPIIRELFAVLHEAS